MISLGSGVSAEERRILAASLSTLVPGSQLEWLTSMPPPQQQQLPQQTTPSALEPSTQRKPWKRGQAKQTLEEDEVASPAPPASAPEPPPASASLQNSEKEAASRTAPTGLTTPIDPKPSAQENTTKRGRPPTKSTPEPRAPAPARTADAQGEEGPLITPSPVQLGGGVEVVASTRARRS
jgi:hypothetical protein